MSEMVTVANLSTDDRMALYPHFRRYGEPGPGDAIWTCSKGHKHQTSKAAEAHGGASLESVSPAILRSMKYGREAEPARYLVVASTDDSPGPGEWYE